MKMWKALVGLVFFASVISVARDTQADEVLTTALYFKVRQILRDNHATPYQGRKACNIIDGARVHLESQVVTVRESGTILADMDSELLSIPEINLDLLDDDQTSHVRKGQNIEYTGRVSGCRYDSDLGTLYLSISYGSLVAHY